MKWMTWNGTQLVPIGGVPAGPGPDPEDPKVPPPAVISLAVNALSPSELRASWLAPQDPNAGGSIHHYEVDLNGVDYNYSLTSTSITFTDLEPDTEYTVTVRAVNNYYLTGPSSTVTGWTDVVVPVSSLVDDWDDIVASGDINTAVAAFESGTGYQAAGYTLSQLQPASGTSTAEGQVIEGKRITGAARWRHNNVTYRGCLIEWSSALYGAYGNPTFGNPYRGIRFEFCTFVGPSSAPDGARRCAVISATTQYAVTFQFCDFSGGTSGIANDSGQGGAVVEYSYVHDLAAATSSNGAHRTSMRTTAGGGRFYRNLVTDGGSSCISLYFDKNPIHDFEVRENIMDGISPNANPSYLITMKQGEHVATASNVKVISNYFGSNYQFGLFNGVSGLFGERGNENSGNVHFATGDPI